jgi:dihydroorotate dehydrogenase electron transfer subunit
VGFTLPAGCRHVLILARGVGLATMAPLAQQAIAADAAVTAILSARSPELVMSEAYLRDVGARVIVVHDEDGSSGVERVEALVRQEHARRAFGLLTTCGSSRLLRLLQALGAEWKVPGQVALEQQMGCALGMCFACVRPFRKEAGAPETSYRRVCWDGPVFDLQETL